MELQEEASIQCSSNVEPTVDMVATTSDFDPTVSILDEPRLRTFMPRRFAIKTVISGGRLMKTPGSTRSLRRVANFGR